MKQIVLLATTITCMVLNGFGQVFQNFESVSSLSSLVANCWQFRGAQLNVPPAAGSKSLALNPLTIGGIASLKTPFIDLNTASTISFAYKLSDTLPQGAYRTISAYLQAQDGSKTFLGSITLDQGLVTNLSTFTTTSPLTCTQKLVIDVSSVGDESVSVDLHSLSIEGNLNYNTPYGCKEQEEDPVSIHYLKNFSGMLLGTKVQLQWTVAENINNNYFEIERSADGINFKPVALVWASSTPAEEAYNYSDPAQAISFYRLKVVSKTNVRMYSNVLVVKNSSGAGGGLLLMQNPVRHSVNFSFASACATTGILTVYNLSGSPVLQTGIKAQKGSNVISTPLDKQLKTGIYLLEFVCGSERSTVKFVKE